MTTLNFPSDPSLNQTYEAGTKKWIWNGVYWKAISPTERIGYTGSQGIQGDLGYTGSQGDLGYTGSEGFGFAGSQGITGFAGSQGEQGVAGFTGSLGNIGFAGSQGPEGELGFTGSRGASGNRSVALAQDGLLIARTGTARWYAPAALTIQEITLRLSAAADQTVTIIINKSGVATRTINMAAGQVKAVNSSSFDMAADEYLTVDVTSIGSPGLTTQGSDLNVVFLYQFSNL